MNVQQAIPTGFDRLLMRSCRFCGQSLEQVLIDLGMSPLCEAFLRVDQLDDMEPTYPLRVYVCGSCFLVQLAEYVAPAQIFTEYAYFSSYSDSWVAHAQDFAQEMVERHALGRESLVVEVGSNDGYLLQHFVARGVPVLGIEPAVNVAASARAAGVDTMNRFFDMEIAAELAATGRQADLIVANNVLAQVPDLNDFVAGLAALLKPNGLLTVEFPHLLRLLQENQFDTIYHEHFSYFSLLTARRIFSAHGLAVFEVEELPTHGGSLRLHVRHAETGVDMGQSVADIEGKERAAGLDRPAGYSAFRPRVEETKRALLAFLIEARRDGRSIAGYGAPGKANTLLNYCGVGTDFLDYTVDRNPYKHGRYTPGTHIPIYPPERIRETRPDYVWILPWNLRTEIVEQLAYIREWGGRFLVAVPRLEILS